MISSGGACLRCFATPLMLIEQLHRLHVAHMCLCHAVISNPRQEQVPPKPRQPSSSRASCCSSPGPLTAFAVQVPSSSGHGQVLPKAQQPSPSRARGAACPPRLRIDSLVVVEGKADRRAVLNALDAPVRFTMRGPAHATPNSCQLAIQTGVPNSCLAGHCLAASWRS